jgi:hypothetical protein
MQERAADVVQKMESNEASALFIEVCLTIHNNHHIYHELT